MDMRRTIVELIEKNDGKWTWYQLDRGMTARGLGGRMNFMEVVTELINEGLIAEERDARYPQPLYRITEKGRAFLSEHS